MTTPSPERELPPCPFCGKAGVIDVGPSQVAGDINRYFPTCSDDGCLGFNASVSYARRAQAISAWSARAPGEGFAAGIEAAAKWHEKQAATLRRRMKSRFGSDDYPCVANEKAEEHIEHAAAIRALQPEPEEAEKP